MARYSAAEYASKHPCEEYLVDSNLSSPSFGSTVTSDFSILENNPLRSSGEAADDWSTSSMALAQQRGIDNFQFRGQESFENYQGVEKRFKVGQDNRGVYEQSQGYRMSPPVMQRQWNSNEMNQRMAEPLYVPRNILGMQGNVSNLQGGVVGNMVQAGVPGNTSTVQSALPGMYNLQRQYSMQNAIPAQQQTVMNQQVAVPLQQVPSQTPYQLPYDANVQRRMVQTPDLRIQILEAAFIRCGQVVTAYIQAQRQRPSDNSVQYWRALFQSFYAEGATQRWCLSCYNSTPFENHARNLFPVEHWRCNLCGVQPGRGFETRVDVLPRLFKFKYDSGLIQELFFMELPTERRLLSNGGVVFEYAKAVNESSFPEIRIIKHGKLRVTFNNQFKICAWEFCPNSHEELVPRNNLLQQAYQLSSLVRKVEKEGYGESPETLKQHCNEFHQVAKQLAAKLDAPSVNDLGFSKRYVRCVQIAEVVESMGDLISFSKATGMGPIDCLAKYPKRQRKIDDSPVSSITYHPSSQTNQAPVFPDRNAAMRLPSLAHLQPDVRAHILQQPGMQHQQALWNNSRQMLVQQQQLFQQQQQQQQQHQQQLNTNSGQSAHNEHSLPGTPQSEMSDLRSNA